MRESELAVVFAHLNERPPKVTELRPELPEAFDDVIATALAKAPDERYARCGDLAAAARAALEGRAVANRRRRRRRELVAAIAVVATAAAAIAAVLAGHDAGQPGARAARLVPLTANAVSVIDPARRRVRGRVVLAKGDEYGIEPSDLAFAAGGAWLVSPGNQRLVRVDPTTRKVERSVTLPWRPGARLTVGGGLVWTSEAGGPGVLGIDPRRGRIVRRFSVPGSNADGLAFGGGKLWVAQGDATVQVDPRNGRVLGRVHNPGQSGSTVWLAYADGWLWSARASGIVRKIDPVAGRISYTARLDGYISDLAVGGGNVWAAKLSDGHLYRLSEEALVDLGGISAGPDPERIALVGDRLWVANGSARTVSVVDIRSGTRRSVPVSAAPTLVAYRNGLLWVGTRPSPRPLAPIAGPELRIASPFAVSPDPLDTRDVVDEQRAYATCVYLVTYADAPGAAGATLRPDVAEAMPTVTLGGRRYTFRVRPGFRFSPPSNAPLTAATFRTSFERALSPKTDPRSRGREAFGDLVGAPAYERGGAAHVSGIAVRGDTISLTLAKPDGDFVARLASPLACPVPVGQPIHPPGSPRPVPSAGPYYVASIEGDRTVLLRNPNYRGPRPRRPERIVYVDDMEAPKAAALADASAIDYTPLGDPPLDLGGAVERRYGRGSAAARAGRQRFFREPMPWIDGLVLNAGRPLFADARMRQAVNYALDRRALASAFSDDPADEFVPPAVAGFEAGSVYPLEPDLARARRLAGGGTHRAKLWYCINGIFGSPAQGQIAQLIRSQLARIGIAVSIVRSNCDTKSRYDRSSRTADLVMFSAGSPNRDAADFLRWALHGDEYGAALGPGPWRDRKFQRRVARAAALRGRSRTRAYVALVGELMRAAPFAIYGSYVSSEYFSPNVRCKLFQRALGFVDLGALCVPARR